MSRKRTKAQIVELNDGRRYQQQTKKKSREDLSDLCKDYLAKKNLFRWFIEKYYGPGKYLELWELAENDQESYLRHELNVIWHELPDSIFNIQSAPAGWEAFVSLIEK